MVVEHLVGTEGSSELEIAGRTCREDAAPRKACKLQGYHACGCGATID